MRVFFIYLFTVYLAMFVQAVLFSGTKPDLVLILVCFYAMRYGQMKGLAYGALAGLLVDCASGQVLGPNIISKSLAGFLITSIRHQFFQWNIVTNTAAIAIFAILDIFIVRVCLEVFTGTSFLARPLNISAVQVVYTVMLSFILYPFFIRREEENSFV